MVARLTDPDLQALDDIWPIGRRLAIPDGGTVVIAGAYKGRYMHYIAERYPKTKLILGFEPQPAAAIEACGRVKRYTNCRLDWRALGDENRDEMLMGNWGTDGCSIVNLTAPTGEASMIEFEEAMDEHNVKCIDCFICNMEGFEYSLLPHIFNNRLDEKYKLGALAVQFHPELRIPEEVSSWLVEYYGKPIRSPGWNYWKSQ